MCLIAFAWKVNPEYRLLVAANRDEFHARPTALAGYWADVPQILAGRDLEAGGTWLGVSREGRFAAVTNFREGQAGPASRSRGELTTDFLRGEAEPMEYARALAGKGSSYSGYNLLVGDEESLVYCSNRGQQEPRLLEPGLYGLSNHLLDTPWPKVRKAKEGLGALLRSGAFGEEDLLRILADRHPAPVEDLPDTGVGEARERTLSPPFIISEVYGTRSSSLLWHGQGGKGLFVEQIYSPAGEPAGRQRFLLGQAGRAAI